MNFSPTCEDITQHLWSLNYFDETELSFHLDFIYIGSRNRRRAWNINFSWLCAAAISCSTKEAVPLAPLLDPLLHIMHPHRNSVSSEKYCSWLHNFVLRVGMSMVPQVVTSHGGQITVELVWTILTCVWLLALQYMKQTIYHQYALQNNGFSTLVNFKRLRLQLWKSYSRCYFESQSF